jgi:hypothetical protein
MHWSARSVRGRLCAPHADAVDVFANTWDAQPKLIVTARAGQVALHDPETLPAVTQMLQPLT